MTTQKRFFTSESVTSGHPDKVSDRISDTILDALLTDDPESRVAVETLVTTGQVHVCGEITTKTYIDMPRLIRQTILDIGYDSSELGFDGESCGILLSIDEQSPDIAAGVSKSWEVREDASNVDPYDVQGAGDQGFIFGFACKETPDYMPLPIWLSHKLAKRLEDVRREGIIDGLYPDGKTQVTVAYEGFTPVGLDTIVVSSHHRKGFDQKELYALIKEHVIDAVLNSDEVAQLNIERNPRVLVNPAGPFEVGGPAGDTGLTGRKLIVDTYGGMARHGGGAFSGKDPSKVDRSAAYAMRWAAKNVVAAGLAERCEIQVAYAIGAAHPVGVYVETFGTATVDEEHISQAIQKVFDLRPAAIIDQLDLKRPIYAPTSVYGHFGHSEYPWEQLNKIEELKAAIK